ncbi:P-loop containing nucleoside triphosphate hydrolase [Sesbania bispinosa]|nr:P-loop containing nucleoside triphosphate hydrolase [Sesbania bispinosa]
MMAETKNYIRNQQLELEEILQEAEHRWLRPAEICQILRNYWKFELTADPPVRPPAGSLFLFDRKSLRYFRKDGHRWRKKKDGKTVREAHEKLKAGSVDVLHCYYAHGEDNKNFQRRSYWMLDDGLLFYYAMLHTLQGCKSGISHLPVVPVTLVGSSRISSAPSSTKTNSPISVVQTSLRSNANKVDQNKDVNSHNDPRASSHAQPISNSIPHSAPQLAHEATGFSELLRNPVISSWTPSLPTFSLGTGLSPWALIQNSSRNTDNMYDKELHVEGSIEGPEADFTVHKLCDARLDAVRGGSKMVQKEHDLGSLHTQLHDHTDHPVVATTTILVKDDGNDKGESEQVESGGLKKLDSFGRWMDKEIGGDYDNSLMASDSGNYWGTLDAHNEDKEVSSLRHMQLDMDSLGPSLSQEQLFSIHDFSPDWAILGLEQSKKLSSETKWGCMFGEIEVSAEVLTENVIRCQTPLHSPGRIPFYVTCSNRLACSEVREFEYHENPTKFISSVGIKVSPEDEVQLQLRLLKLVELGPDKKLLKCSYPECERCKLKGTMYSMRDDSGVFEETFQINRSDQINPRDVLFQRLIRDKLYEWLVFKVHEEEKGLHVLDNEGQGVIHLAASLGYVWALGPLVAAGISPNFRDAHGRTGLHWASYFGREETVIALVKLGAAPGAVEDPTSAFPRGKTAADLASRRGHKGIAGYLAESDLTSQLSILTVNENDMYSIATTTAADSAFEAAEGDSSNMTMDEQHCLKQSLAAFRKSAHAAASIQAVFRARSFCQRQLAKGSSDISETVHDLVADSMNKVQKMGHFEDYLHFAALRIQKRYRGWKGRKDFLKIRNRIVKIQAHFRGHRVRKQYKKVVWSVSVVEKAILRWRRKELVCEDSGLGSLLALWQKMLRKVMSMIFLALGGDRNQMIKKALDRVKSMVRQRHGINI